MEPSEPRRPSRLFPAVLASMLGALLLPQAEVVAGGTAPTGSAEPPAGSVEAALAGEARGEAGAGQESPKPALAEEPRAEAAPGQEAEEEEGEGDGGRGDGGRARRSGAGRPARSGALEAPQAADPDRSAAVQHGEQRQGPDTVPRRRFGRPGQRGRPLHPPAATLLSGPHRQEMELEVRGRDRRRRRGQKNRPRAARHPRHVCALRGVRDPRLALDARQPQGSLLAGVPDPEHPPAAGREVVRRQQQRRRAGSRARDPLSRRGPGGQAGVVGEPRRGGPCARRGPDEVRFGGSALAATSTRATWSPPGSISIPAGR